ncbi:MAG: ribosome silencing factor [Bacillota bacterium]
MKTTEVVQALAKIALDKKAQDVVILDLRPQNTFTDFFIICHGQSERQVQAIARAYKDHPLEEGLSIQSIEGEQGGRWILLDLSIVVINIFHQVEREFYALEKLWGDATRIALL